MSNIREFSLKIANSKVVKSFYPTLIAKRLNIPLSEVKKELDMMVEEGIIQKKYELNCPECLRTLDVQTDSKKFKQEYLCNFCGEEIEDIEDIKFAEIYTGKDK